MHHDLGIKLPKPNFWREFMMSLSKRRNVFFIFVLSAIMWLTRGHHLASLTHLPDASWAIFFVIGFYFSSFAVIALFLAQAFLIDYLVFVQLGIGQSCFTTAYAFLLPAYLSLWFAGKWLSMRYALNLLGFKNFIFAAVSGVIICELISSGSYYFINTPGSTSFGEFMSRQALYLPHALLNALAYLTLALVAHLVIIAVGHKATPPSKVKF
jgi:hypothetical protein